MLHLLSNFLLLLVYCYLSRLSQSIGRFERNFFLVSYSARYAVPLFIHNPFVRNKSFTGFIREKTGKRFFCRMLLFIKALLATLANSRERLSKKKQSIFIMNKTYLLTAFYYPNRKLIKSSSDETVISSLSALSNGSNISAVIVHTPSTPFME